MDSSLLLALNCGVVCVRWNLSIRILEDTSKQDTFSNPKYSYHSCMHLEMRHFLLPHWCPD